jgi:hypothetical protein
LQKGKRKFSRSRTNWDGTKSALSKR